MKYTRLPNGYSIDFTHIPGDPGEGVFEITATNEINGQEIFTIICDPDDLENAIMMAVDHAYNHANPTEEPVVEIDPETTWVDNAINEARKQ